MIPTTFDIKKAESSTTATTQENAIGDINEDSSNGIVPQKEDIVKMDYSLSSEQQEYFKDSVVRDENGDLKVMYHGTSKGGHKIIYNESILTGKKGQQWMAVSPNKFQEKNTL